MGMRLLKAKLCLIYQISLLIDRDVRIDRNGKEAGSESMPVPLSPDAQKVSRGCLFCKGGKEREVVQLFLLTFPQGKAVVPTRIRYRRKPDSVTEESITLMPGYVFFELAGLDPADEPAEEGTDAFQSEVELRQLCRTDSILRLLRDPDGRWRLRGADDRFAEMMFRNDGVIGMSKAYFDRGQRIRILEGFLKDYEGSITRVNKKTKTVEVSVDLQGKQVRMWLGYELVDASEGGDDGPQ